MSDLHKTLIDGIMKNPVTPAMVLIRWTAFSGVMIIKAIPTRGSSHNRLRMGKSILNLQRREIIN